MTAVISDCGKYRYRLSRRWNHAPPLVFVMLNPSTADAAVDDPTIRKCSGFAARSGFGGIEVVNLYAYRATDPKDLRRAGYPVGPDNDDHIRDVLAPGWATVCAWGVNARGLSRPQDVLRMVSEPLVLKLSKDGIPCHPLMLPYSCRPINMRALVEAPQQPRQETSDASELNDKDPQEALG